MATPTHPHRNQSGDFTQHPLVALAACCGVVQRYFSGIGAASALFCACVEYHHRRSAAAVPVFIVVNTAKNAML